MYLITGLGQRNKPYVLGDYGSGVGQHEPVGWPARLYGFGEPQASYYHSVGGFAFDKADLSPAQQAKIIDIARDVIRFNIRRVRLVGHTDPAGSPQYNKGLGQRRADMVRRALIAALESRSPGSTKSVAIITDSAGAMQPVPGWAPPAQRRVAVNLLLEPPPPPPSPPPSPPPPRLRPSLPPLRLHVPPPGYREPPRMNPVEPGDKIRGAIYTAQRLEENFRKAERSDDIKGMAKAAEAYYELLGHFPPQGPDEPMPGRGAMQRQREQILAIREDILRQAPNLASIVRNLGTWDLAVLRGKIAEYVRQRALAGRLRRSRVRR